MPRLPLSATGATSHERLLGHNPVILHAWLALEAAIFGTSTFDPDFREQLRRALAFGNQCEYCMAKAGPPVHTGQSERLSLALAFADLVGQDHRSITEEHIQLLRREFSTSEISELVAFVSFISASQIFGAVLGLGAEDLPTVPDAGSAGSGAAQNTVTS